MVTALSPAVGRLHLFFRVKVGSNTVCNITMGCKKEEPTRNCIFLKWRFFPYLECAKTNVHGKKGKQCSASVCFLHNGCRKLKLVYLCLLSLCPQALRKTSDVCSLLCAISKWTILQLRQCWTNILAACTNVSFDLPSLTRLLPFFQFLESTLTSCVSTCGAYLHIHICK